MLVFFFTCVSAKMFVLCIYKNVEQVGRVREKVGKETQPVLYVCCYEKEVPRCISRGKSETVDAEEAHNIESYNKKNKTQ